jgi:hypothetical protein
VPFIENTPVLELMVWPPELPAIPEARGMEQQKDTVFFDHGRSHAEYS